MLSLWLASIFISTTTTYTKVIEELTKIFVRRPADKKQAISRDERRAKQHDSQGKETSLSHLRWKRIWSNGLMTLSPNNIRLISYMRGSNISTYNELGGRKELREFMESSSSSLREYQSLMTEIVTSAFLENSFISSQT